MQPSQLSAGQILQLVRQGTCRTRKELVAFTGLSRSTVADRVDRLIEARYLRESGLGASGGGRPPSVLGIDPDHRVVLVADLGATYASVALTNLANSSLAEESAHVRIDQGPEPVLGWVRDTFHRLLEKTGRALSEVCGIGIGLPGSVDQATGRVMRSFLMPDWDDFPVRDFMGRFFDVPILVENDARVMALGEWHTAWRECTSLMLVKVSTGIGAGLMFDGKIYRGVEEAAGNIGHVRLDKPHDHICTCGSRGCVASVASGAAIARDLAARGRPAQGSRDVVRLVQSGDPDAIALVQEAGRTLGRVLATAVNLLNPGVLVLAGDMAETAEHYLTGIRETVYWRSLPFSTRNLRIVTSALGNRSGIVGASTLVVDHVLDARTVDATLAARTG